MSLETPQHLYSPPQYQTNRGQWHANLELALGAAPETVHWDLAALLSLASNGFVTGDRTLLREITRQPWMSEIEPDGAVSLVRIPPHDYYYMPAEEIAADFIQLVAEEAKRVCEGRRQIFILLSGGLDSRIVAGILARLKQSGEVTSNLGAVTWGLADSRDVVYAQKVARLLGLDWMHIDLKPEHLYENIETTAHLLGSSVSPFDVHRMPWFENVNDDALVLAASYGDSVGRAEFSGSHLLELRGIRIVNSFGLIKPKASVLAAKGIQKDRQTLFSRTSGVPNYVLFEHEMQGHYMRNQIAHVMTVINRYCSVYQMFTDPALYRFMWSIHPAYRFNQVYVETLRQIHPRLLQLPWARTNAALRGTTVGRERGHSEKFHDYVAWVAGPLYDAIVNTTDPEWFETMGIFNGEAIARLLREVRYQRTTSKYAAHRLLWLASLRLFAERVQSTGKALKTPDLSYIRGIAQSENFDELPSLIKLKSRVPKTVRRRIKGLRRIRLRVRALKAHHKKTGRPRKYPGSPT